MTYPKAIQFLYDLRLFGTKLGLENTFRLAVLCGNPQDKLRFIHVAGTNGKGSTCAMLESIYRGAGYRTGFFTSPHLVSFTERVQVNRQPISPEDVIRYVQEIISVVERENEGEKNYKLWEFCPTFFEFVTVMALRYFADQQCEIVIWETGMGGRLDATNIVRPLASVITNIGRDHELWLGDALEQIAAEKAGIIKEHIAVITATRDREALEVIRRTATEKSAPLIEVSESDLAQPIIRNIQLSLRGEHQRWNATLAVATARTLQPVLPVTVEQVIKGLETVNWSGRLQLVQVGTSKVLLDGAHNPNGVLALRAALEADFGSERITIILGLLKDKAWQRMCEILVPIAERVLLVPVQSERSADPHIVEEFCASLNATAEVTHCPNLKISLEAALRQPFVVIAGSLHLVGEAIELLGLSAGAPNERALNEWDATRAGKV